MARQRGSPGVHRRFRAASADEGQALDAQDAWGSWHRLEFPRKLLLGIQNGDVLGLEQIHTRVRGLAVLQLRDPK